MPSEKEIESALRVFCEIVGDDYDPEDSDEIEWVDGTSSTLLEANRESIRRMLEAAEKMRAEESYERYKTEINESASYCGRLKDW